ncbi:hypothetical protein HDV06_006058 [Boothiomyces sp. JEL0866]|nr:hypothetical protein HDV06_006008 [Boothiomyces sp. JEL0866]KAJ3324800.1 hypothetical protein HDV06_006058 [Boothiomyces sp. JEL0866]
MMEAIECKILILKEYQRDSMKELLDQERLLSLEIKTLQAGIDKSENISLSRTASTASNINGNPSNLLPEVVEFQKFAGKYGHEGGWESSNHQAFVKLARKYHGDKLYRICAKKLPLVTYEEALEHDNWFRQYDEKYKANKEAIQLWKNKPRDELIPKQEKINKVEPSNTQQDREMQKYQVLLWRKAKNEEMRKQNELNQKNKLAELEKKKIEKQKQEFKRQLLQKQREELEKQKKPAPLVQVPKPKSVNYHLIKMKQKIFQEQYLEKKASLKLKREEAEREKQARLNKLAEKVQVNIKHDPDRLFKPTASMLYKQSSATSMDNLVFIPTYGQGRAIPAWSKDINR